MASLDDILTSTKNIVTALNNAAQTYINVAGAQNATKISAATVASANAGRLVNIVVTTAGSAAGAVYDANVLGVTTAPIYTIPNTTGVYVVNMPVVYGILVVPGTSQVVSISYS